MRFLLAFSFSLILLACSSDTPSPDAAASDPRVAVQKASTPGFETLTLPDSAITPPADSTARRFERAMRLGQRMNVSDRPVGEVMQALGLTFSKKPYLEGTLDAPPTEELVVRLDGFDCVTYVETLLAMARGLKEQDTSYAGFARRLAEIRYRAGQPMGYCSRLHYFSDWIRDNDRARFVEDVTPRFASRTFRDTINFMSTHRDAYRRFATNDSLLACVQDMETALARAVEGRPLRYVPQDSIRAVYSELQAGDIIGIVSSVDGLDIAHTGLAYLPNPGTPPAPLEESVGLLHASLSGGVVVSPDLQRYVQQIGHMIGIVVARPRPVDAGSEQAAR
jgi:hypothetical protein